jgi:hypothetical protein
VAAPALHCLPSVRLSEGVYVLKFDRCLQTKISSTRDGRLALPGGNIARCVGQVQHTTGLLPWLTVFLAVQHGEIIGTGKFTPWALRCEVSHASRNRYRGSDRGADHTSAVGPASPHMAVETLFLESFELGGAGFCRGGASPIWITRGI